jgi:hypothetical protein
MHCNISVFGGTMDVESIELCQYANYHIIMFVVCGPASIVFMCMAMAMIAYHRDDMNGQQQDTLDGCTSWAFTFFLLSAGFEGSFVLFVALVYLSLLLMVISKCIKIITIFVHPRSNAAVVAVMMVQEHHLVGIPAAAGVHAQGEAVIITGASVVESTCFYC